jgi:hypothetical protein
MSRHGSLARLPTRKVLYILGWGRSGTTVLDNILGEADDVFSCGELNFLWRRGLEIGGTCGCGDPVRDCVVWSDVLATAFGKDWARTLHVDRILRWYSRTIRVRRTRQLLRTSPDGVSPSSGLGRYLDLLGRLYHGIAEVTGARVIVDSSKRPCDAALLRLLPNVSPYFVHMVRDPRAVAYSWQRARAMDLRIPEMMMTRHSPSYSTTHWLAWNAGSNAIQHAYPSRSLLLRYEDFTRSPRTWVERILALVEEEGSAPPFDDERTVRLHANHTVSGNPSRFTAGRITIRRDDEWVACQGTRDRFVSTALALPYLPRYGYPLWPSLNGRDARRRGSPPSSPAEGGEHRAP